MDGLYHDTFGWDYDVDQEDSNVCQRHTQQAKKASQEKTTTTCFTDHKVSTDFEARPLKRPPSIAAPSLSSGHEFRSRLSMPDNALDQYWRLPNHQNLSVGNYSMVQLYEDYHLTQPNDDSDTFGLWASCEDDSWLRARDWFEKKRRLVKREGVIGALFGTWKLTQFDVD
ncbi:hypothetical protein SLS62_007656 [Diatrype stigma]|uniref:Uncharacterized protein n=1 Tax=Diatrype stigma TaxID=117547 RepID=A0AAN9UNY9_9PEZI